MQCSLLWKEPTQMEGEGNDSRRLTSCEEERPACGWRRGRAEVRKPMRDTLNSILQWLTVKTKVSYFVVDTCCELGGRDDNF